MNWANFSIRAILLIITISGLLYLVELTMTLGALLVFLLVISFGLTWVIINLLKDDNILSDLFDD